MESFNRRRRMMFGMSICVAILALALIGWSGWRWMHVQAVPTSPSIVASAPSAPASADEVAPDDAPSSDALPDEGDASVPVAQTPTPAPVIVYITGAVLHPDTYLLPAQARIKDVVIAAGGLARNADSERINLAEHISDGQHIRVPFVGEVAPPDTTGTASAGASNDQQGQGGRININTASPAELEPLPAIGKALAQRIVDWRTANGPFQSTSDVQKVKGITSTVYEAIKDKITT